MIIDTLDRLALYAGVTPLFNDVVEFIRNNNLNELAAGKHEIRGGDLYVNITAAKGKTCGEAVLETHKKMIDIQIPLSAPETYGYTPLCNLPDAQYDAEKDITKIPGLAADSYVTCAPGMFAIFFPQDGHAPCISDKAEIKKAIFKVLA